MGIFLHRGGNLQGQFTGRIERNRRLMPSRRFLAADLEAYSRCSRGNRSVSATICLVSMIASRLPGIVTFRFRELLPSLHRLSHAKDCDLRIEPCRTLTRLLLNVYIFKIRLFLSINGNRGTHLN